MYNQSAASTRTSQPKTPPTSLAAKEALLEAVELYANWAIGEPEPTLPFENDDILISEACFNVSDCRSPIPTSCRDTLRFCDIEPTPKTYAEAAHALLQAIKKVRRAH